MKINILWAIIFMTSYAFQISGIPRHVMIIRHGELTSKPESRVNFKGWHLKKIHLKNSQPLSARGWQRAYALAPFFTMQPDILKYGKIVALYAPYPNSDYNSVRPIQTLTPLSQKTKKKINVKCNIDQGGSLVYEIMREKKYDNQCVLIAYEHMHIPRLAQLFDMFFKYDSLIQQQSSGISVQRFSDGAISLVPTQWGEYQDGTSIFDQVWVLTFDTESGRITNFDNIPQILLYQDSAKPFYERPVHKTQAQNSAKDGIDDILKSPSLYRQK